ncbi:SDR family NAD(P)-dependent oxidoreductase [Limosilactobacillus sp.]|jgi:short-subunit dehydrogenase|uniref:SDR family NAD(P)-dependent oxidoreductase n=1 Tax=Limosilactobacillus sp. TaxID=2773925 RepID=UPI0025BB5809|nr:SDR family oxidoreductase [Limosilactobacillus sp.]MCH3922564.1 SDR family oxidoreductase [Limosilactobacillus sp.]MCH3927246.1 SDR family oxidoreductase [Limosilactobacillus sp.]
MLRRVKTLRFLRNEVVLITGGSSGIGKQLALEAARRGAIVVVAARNQEKLQKVAKKCLILSGRPAFAYQLDVTDPDAIDQVLDKIQHEVGSIDVLINSAGLGDFTEVADQHYSSMAKMVHVNLLALMYISRCVAKQMMDQGYGAIINIASLAGKIPTPSSAVYSATKAGVIQFDNVLRMEVADYGVQVLTVNPGPISTKFWAKGDPNNTYQAHLPKWMFIEPDELARRIWDNVGYQTREINVPTYVACLGWAYRVIPGLSDWAIKKFFDFQQDKDKL